MPAQGGGREEFITSGNWRGKNSLLLGCYKGYRSPSSVQPREWSIRKVEQPFKRGMDGPAPECALSNARTIGSPTESAATTVPGNYRVILRSATALPNHAVARRCDFDGSRFGVAHVGRSFVDDLLSSPQNSSRCLRLGRLHRAATSCLLFHIVGTPCERV